MRYHLDHYIWVFIFGAILLGLLLPGPGLLFKPTLSYLLIALMTLSCLKIKVQDIKKAFLHKQVYLVVAITLFVTPLLAWFAKPFLDPLAFAGLILATAVPAGVSVVFICNLCHGLPSDALSITTLSHLLSIVTVPLLLLLFVGQSVSIDIIAVVSALLKFIAVPLILAQFIRPFITSARFVSAASTILIIFIIWGIVAPAQPFLTTQLNYVLLLSGISAACIIAALLRLRESQHR